MATGASKEKCEHSVWSGWGSCSESRQNQRAVSREKCKQVKVVRVVKVASYHASLVSDSFELSSFRENAQNLLGHEHGERVVREGGKYLYSVFGQFQTRSSAHIQSVLETGM